jgi:hypothetical protein
MPDKPSPEKAERTGHSRRRPSPILVPGEPTSSTLARVRRWLGELLEGRKTPGTSRRAPAPATRHPAGASGATKPLEADGAAMYGAPDSLHATDQPDSAARASAPEQPVHRATTHLLPGRLQPLDPEVIEQEIRFVKAKTFRDTQVVTLGWNLGEPPEHVTLDHPSIQPLHARMTYQRGHWMIESLTEADPVQINDALLLRMGVPYLLSDGDRIRIGKALFRFAHP